ncbi:transposase [Streptomyces pimonensis]|uniref:Transposase n=1 Tax=Streptomyces pimonensis TaxID=2860288 RepID=A0ABV4J2V7_9ACTN
MGSKYTKRYPDEYKRDAIELVRPSGRTVTGIAREPGAGSKSLRGWMKKARAAQDPGHRTRSHGGAVRAEHREQPGRLRLPRRRPLPRPRFPPGARPRESVAPLPPHHGSRPPPRAGPVAACQTRGV